ncbi:unnamed protein product, partial [Mesorhabditis belari]|uniref:Flavin-containing monooxygenase n=1 Tax=Mesorhabditis belari TaxID=2138241 RepID=A0AAF3J3N2_9BILA
MERQMKVCVVGAGASGLPSIHWAKLYGFQVTCFEASPDIGGLWRYKDHSTQESSVMRGTVINTSKEMTAYSDYPPPADFPNFMHNAKLMQYFRSYADEMDLLPHIKLNHKVLNIQRTDDYGKTGQWSVQYQDGDGQTNEEIFDGVLLCTGHHANNNMPKWDGMESFPGKIIHSHDYKSPDGYGEKTVIVVGMGNSGVDVACELGRVSKQTYLVSRRGAWVFSRMKGNDKCFDMELNNRFITLSLLKVLPFWMLERMVEWDVEKRFDHEKFGLKPKHHIFSAHPTLSDELPNRVMSGTVKVKPGISKFVGSTVYFEDGTKAENVDEVVCCTGYSFTFPLLEKGNLLPVTGNRHGGIYKFMFPLQIADKNSLALIGLVQPWGSIMPISEMQARVFFANLRGDIKLPEKEMMKKEAVEAVEALGKRYVDSPRHTLQVDFVPYIEDLAKMIDCHPDEWNYVFSDPILFKAVQFGPNVAYVYRLRGPFAWKGARKAVMEVMDRVDQGISGGRPRKIFRDEGAKFYVDNGCERSRIRYLPEDNT